MGNCELKILLRVERNTSVFYIQMRKFFESLNYKYFNTILHNKKAKIKKNYQIIHSHMLKIQKLINSRKILKAKIQLGELFTELCDLNDIIDLTDYNDLRTCL